ncbi:hypothetical protein CEUSTIGMA_g12020.t1 [Chlamydomonas eustigma]|uniref:Nuclear cap-binding protein subunit 3 n=1 Tax=Chlamydomonas eustigma TaxID=1157962 RepID=A0A250XNS3_9CHLO|nr:hypothetical protein CEUSTIGMA_g12020.t1 [Chlamydomonas eustigma]|eukprot:GAX84599.1 hypothetical protein CEUSTIGMA_g12020.t1 [Chlamydomonas eustigma]
MKDNKIVWGLPPKSDNAGILAEEESKHKKRAERFGTSFVDPTTRRDLVGEAKKERLKREGFVTGFDPFCHDEILKRLERAQRFDLEATPVNYHPNSDIAAKNLRAKKFGVAYEATSAVLMDMDLFEERLDVDPSIERRPDAVYLYGVDVMSTKDVLSYFSDYGPSYVEWLNDSACNVLFAEASSAKRAMLGRGQPLPPQQCSEWAVSIEFELLPDLDPTDISNMPFLWHQGEDFIKEGTAIKLIYRMATMMDKKDPNAKKSTRELWKAGATSHEEGKVKRLKQTGTTWVTGDVLEAGTDMKNKSRGGKRVRRRKIRSEGMQGLSTYEDVEMEDVDAIEVSGDYEKSTFSGSDLRGMIYSTKKDLKEQPIIDMGPSST